MIVQDCPDRATTATHPRVLRLVALTLVTVAYLFLSWYITVPHSSALRLDYYLYHLHLRRHYPSVEPWVLGYVTLGQRGPATLASLPYFGWVAWRTRSARPFVMLVTSLILLNISVGVVKLAIGRLGPRQTNNPFELFVNGNIYPSGHVSNAVVLYGLIAWISLSHRRSLAVAAAFISLTVGLGTVFANTHWFTDVVAGWLAGALVLLLLPTVLPTVERWSQALFDRLRSRLSRRRARRTARTPAAGVPEAEVPTGVAAAVASAATAAADLGAPDVPREPASVGAGTGPEPNGSSPSARPGSAGGRRTAAQSGTPLHPSPEPAPQWPPVPVPLQRLTKATVGASGDHSRP